MLVSKGKSVQSERTKWQEYGTTHPVNNSKSYGIGDLQAWTLLHACSNREGMNNSDCPRVFQVSLLSRLSAKPCREIEFLPLPSATIDDDDLRDFLPGYLFGNE